MFQNLGIKSLEWGNEICCPPSREDWRKHPLWSALVDVNDYMNIL